MTIRWFGLLPFARLCEDTPQAPIPVGEACGWCHEPININDNGIYFANTDSPPFHHECFTRMIIGSAAHQEGTCSCNGGEDHDPPELTLRESAKLAHLTFLARRSPE